MAPEPRDAQGQGRLNAPQEFCAKGADHHYEVGPFRLGRYGWLRWDATLHGAGAGNRRTPIGAMWGAWRFHRELARNPGRYAR